MCVRIVCSKCKKYTYSGKFTSGYYNDMEAGHPVFIDGDSLSDVVKGILIKNGLDPEFCYDPDGDATDLEGCSEDVTNPLIGKRVKLVIEILD